ncbi:phosphoglycerate dehydrogenase [Sulfuriroseicoccus oceanibius]|uniref:D-3-phosphoglycerate dehydrogenase n=1 Tax=Sulfuriroseicoccus oceanibius TaxID=2707525 RepID=A0A6B3L8V2_9BACT|nr:phosphoglycerate dehydrogenase [Sulfuriroseicoccus oceanibius]QQL45845.1 phosphoglycerate dehydrogenase [Sulfuriroseicoccus oceanibius]
MSTTHRILVADPISEAGIEKLKADPAIDVDVRIGISPEDLLADAALYHGIIVRSQTKITREVLEKASNLKAIGRAGVGVDNIDVEAATEHGVIVMNTPAGNTISTAEHAFTLMMSMARHIPQAHASIVAGRWDRKKYVGVELYQKTLLILGMGRIGTEFARRAMAFGMRVIAYDPFLSASRARLLSVELADQIDDALPEADFITMHMPLTPDTKHLLNRERLTEKVKPGVRIVNCARGGLIDEAALADALESGRVAGAALDVYEAEPPGDDFALRGSEKMVFTPHLGASTVEAQENVGTEIADTVRNQLVDGTVVNSVNMPSIDPKTLEEIGAYLTFTESLGRLAATVAPRNAERFRIEYSGGLSEKDTTLVTRAGLKGLIDAAWGDTEINYLNAPANAKRLGLQITESKQADPGEFTDLIKIIVTAGDQTTTVAGTLFGGKPRVVLINDHHVEGKAEGNVLIVENNDQPGMIGQMGSILGNHGVNIAHMALSRSGAGEKALVFINLDSTPSDEVLDELRAQPSILSAVTAEI